LFAAVYVGIVMAICTMSLVMNIIVLNIYHTSPQTHMPRWVRTCYVLSTLYNIAYSRSWLSGSDL